MSGLVLITLPIGNNKDLTFRAKEKIEELEFIVAEDTRVFKEFCKNNAISIEGKRIESFHDHAENAKIDKIVSWTQHRWVGIVSDAGSPVISDPAFPLIRKVLENNIPLATVPGVSAVTTALELSGLPPSPFHFHAFIAREGGKKDTFFEEMSSVYGTHIFFEGVSRVEKTMDKLALEFPKESFCIARELTKTFESVYRFKGNEWEELKKEIVFKGEFVILFYNPNKGTGMSGEIIKLAEEIIVSGAHPKKLSKLLSEITGKPTKEIYQLLLEHRS